MLNSLAPTRASNLERLALGTAQFGLNYGISNQRGQIGFNDAVAIVRLSNEHGINTLDTAVGYGESEARLGAIGITGWQVVSKLPAVPGQCDDIHRWVNVTVRESLARLKVESLYALLLHRSQELLKPYGDQLYRALLQLKRDKLVTKIGVSIYDPLELDLLTGRYDLEVVQSPLNIVDRRLIDSGWLYRLASHGVEIHARSIFLQGLLLMQAGSRPSKFNRWMHLWSRWDHWLEQADVTPLRACLAYVLSVQQIKKVVLGVENASQLNEVLKAVDCAALLVPNEFSELDPDLINPSNWENLN